MPGATSRARKRTRRNQYKATWFSSTLRKRDAPAAEALRFLFSGVPARVFRLYYAAPRTASPKEGSLEKQAGKNR